MSDSAIAWHDWFVDDAGEGRVALITAAGKQLGAVTIAPAAPWTLTHVGRDVDSLQFLWTSQAGELRVRHSWGALWHITVDQPPTAAGAAPVLSVAAAADAPIPWLWGAGAQARAILWLPGDAGLLELRQMQGEAVVVESAGEHRGLGLASSNSTAPTTSRWRIEPLQTLTQVVSGLPGWLPELVVDAGDTITIERPDAGIETDLPTAQDDLATEITVPAGVHRVVIHESGGAVRLDLHGARLPSDDLTVRATRLARLDPRALAPSQLFLVEHGAEHFDADFLDAVAERALSLAVSSADPDPFALAAAAMGLSRADPGDVPDLVADLAGAASRWPDPPPVGSLLAWEWLARAAAIAGLPRVSLPVARPRGRNLTALEHAVVTGEARQIRRLMSWALQSLGRELPGVPAEGRLGPLVGLVRNAPARWLSDSAAAGTLSLRERQVLCGPDDDAAWLLW